MAAWTSDPVARKYLHDRTPLERQGPSEQTMPQVPHAPWNGVQGGPPLDDIASRLTEDQIIRQVLQGGGNMAAYGNALNRSGRKL